eukprot:4844062-Prymnesium_polylepis.2
MHEGCTRGAMCTQGSACASSRGRAVHARGEARAQCDAGGGGQRARGGRSSRRPVIAGGRGQRPATTAAGRICAAHEEERRRAGGDAYRDLRRSARARGGVKRRESCGVKPCDAESCDAEPCDVKSCDAGRVWPRATRGLRRGEALAERARIGRARRPPSHPRHARIGRVGTRRCCGARVAAARKGAAAARGSRARRAHVGCVCAWAAHILEREKELRIRSVRPPMPLRPLTSWMWLGSPPAPWAHIAWIQSTPSAIDSPARMYLRCESACLRALTRKA